MTLCEGTGGRGNVLLTIYWAISARSRLASFSIQSTVHSLVSVKKPRLLLKRHISVEIMKYVRGFKGRCEVGEGER